MIIQEKNVSNKKSKFLNWNKFLFYLFSGIFCVRDMPVLRVFNWKIRFHTDNFQRKTLCLFNHGISVLKYTIYSCKTIGIFWYEWEILNFLKTSDCPLVFLLQLVTCACKLLRNIWLLQCPIPILKVCK